MKGEIKGELRIESAEKDSTSMDTCYGTSNQPLGLLKIKIIEYLVELYQYLPTDKFNDFLDPEIFNYLLHYFEKYPFHNILHQKVAGIFLSIFERSPDSIIKILEQTLLVQKILSL